MSRLTEITVPDDIVQKARCGDDGAQAHIYSAMSPAVFGLIRRIVSNRALAEDLFQDTMMIVFERLGAFRGEAPLGAWVRQVAVTRCLMYLRSPWHRSLLWLDADDSPVPPPIDTASRPDAQACASADVEKLLAMLPAITRSVVWLHDVEGYTHGEIARLLGRTTSFSKSQLARAHTRMRELLDPASESLPCTPVSTNC